MKSRNHRRAERIRKEVDILRMLADFDYEVRTDGGDREQQFSCDLHGDGSDNKPSARVYPDSDSWYCFGCSVSRDAIQTVRDKKDMSFVEALGWLEKKYQLPPMSFEEGDQQPFSKSPLVDADFHRTRTYEDDRKRLERLLDNVTQDKSLPMRRTLTFWEAHDQVHLKKEKGEMPEQVAQKLLVRLRNELLDEVTQESQS